jgi:hypothetical protein
VRLAVRVGDVAEETAMPQGLACFMIATQGSSKS